MTHLLHSYFKKKMTFMVVPHDGGKPVQIKTNLFLIHFLLLAFAGLITWAALAASKDVNYKLAQLNEQRYKTNMQQIMGELQTNRALLTQMSDVDSQFRKLLKLGDRKQVFSQFNGMGGPTEEDSARFSQILQEKNDQLLSKVNASLRMTNQQAAQQDASFKEISTYLDKQRSILAATPSIWPIKGWITSGFGRRASPLTGEPGATWAWISPTRSTPPSAARRTVLSLTRVGRRATAGWWPLNTATVTAAVTVIAPASKSRWGTRSSGGRLSAMWVPPGAAREVTFIMKSESTVCP